MNSKYVANPTASAAADEKAERAINALPPDELFALAAYAAAWDEVNAEGQEEERNRLALVQPALPWHVLLPVAAVCVVIIFLAWGA